MNDSTILAAQAVPAVDSLPEVTVLFALVLALALLIERLLELLTAGYLMLDSRYDFHTFWTRRAGKVRDYVEKKLRVFDHVSPEKVAPVLNRFNEMLLNGQGTYSGTVPIIAGDLVRTLWVRVGSKLLGVIIGIGLARALELDLVALWQLQDSGTPGSVSHYLLTGIAIGLGSGPIHKIITTIEKRRKKREEKGGAK